ncbi:hypothetical protein [Nitrospira lenta]|uniref:Uncharacterized protein n=1 Tax=Nitrospira lenta TaxID=1436998 RepID=A0A330LC88_9BACT|nr:hypothetical protein [Nitrospira lenta]SPP66700.1 hypothetical protein NITLEN_80128 [Nitrospira lenta]
MEQQKKESYAEPVLIAHELLRDVTGGASGVKNPTPKAGSEGPAI